MKELSEEFIKSFVFTDNENLKNMIEKVVDTLEEYIGNDSDPQCTDAATIIACLMPLATTHLTNFGGRNGSEAGRSVERNATIQIVANAKGYVKKACTMNAVVRNIQGSFAQSNDIDGACAEEADEIMNRIISNKE